MPKGRAKRPLVHYVEVGLAHAYRVTRFSGLLAALAPRLAAHRFTAGITPNGHRWPELRIGFASDFHVGPCTSLDLIRQASAALAAFDPHVLLLGGDYVASTTRTISPLLPELLKVPAPLGRFAVLGNHDLWNRECRVTEELSSIGIKVLVNESAQLAPPFHDVFICGLDDPWSGRPDAARTFEGAEGLRIVLMHGPDGLLSIGDQRFELALCGHTHGGQVATPNQRPLFLPHGKLNRRYHGGRYSVGVGTLVVSRGVGNATVLPFRINAPPDVILCTVRGSHKP